MDALQDLIERCHRRHEKPLRQQRAVAIPSMYTTGYIYQYSVYCAYSYPVRLDDLEAAEISFMPIGPAPEYDSGPISFGQERFLRRQRRQDWGTNLWDKSLGIQVYTGIPSGRKGAHWHDLNFTYQAICAAPDAVFDCIETLVSIVVEPLLTLTQSGGLRFSCRVPDYLHPKTEQEKVYVYKHTPTPENPHQHEVYLEILGDEGYSCWDGRHEILHGNLLDPPVIVKEALFAPLDALRAALHQPAPPGEERLTVIPAVPRSLGTRQLNLAKRAFVRNGYSYLREENGFHYWHPPDNEAGDAQVLLWETDGTVWVRATTSDTEFPTEARPITDVWDDTGILPPVPAGGPPISERIRTVREEKRSPLSVRWRRRPVLQKSEDTQEDQETLEEKIVQIRRASNAGARVLGLTIGTAGKNSDETVSALFNSRTVCLNVPTTALAEEAEQHCHARNVSSVAHWKPRSYRWDAVKEIPVDERMANPFQHGNVCEDPERCDALEEKGGNPRESICPQCPVYTECQENGYLSQLATLQPAEVQISTIPKLFFSPHHTEVVEEMLEQADAVERLCIVNEAKVNDLFFNHRLPKSTLEEWGVNWHGSALGNFAKTLLSALDIMGRDHSDAVRRVRAVVRAFEWQEKETTKQMCQVNVPGRVAKRGTIDAETGAELARFTIAFEGGTSAYIPLDSNAAHRLTVKGLPLFQLDDFVLNEDMKIPMSMTQAIGLGIFDIETVSRIGELPTVCRDPNWTYWHQLKHFFARYTRNADAPMRWNEIALFFWGPPVLHEQVKRLLLMSPILSERHLRRAFREDEVEIIHTQPTAWVTGNQVFQIRTGTYTRQRILDYHSAWETIGLSKIGTRFLFGMRAEIERDPSIKHAIITHKQVTQLLESVTANENVCLLTDFAKVRESKTAVEEADVIWIVGMPAQPPNFVWRHAQMLFGDDEEPLDYEIEEKSGHYIDERVQSVYEERAARSIIRVIEYAGLDRFPGKKVMLICSLPLPGITDRPETLLFDWEDFEVAGELNKLAEMIATRQRFEAEKATLTADTPREEVERILGCSRTQANRVLYDLRGGRIPHVPFREQILSLLASGGETRARALIAGIDGHPKAIDNELRRLVGTGEIVKLRRGVYALPSPESQRNNSEGE